MYQMQRQVKPATSKRQPKTLSRSVIKQSLKAVPKGKAAAKPRKPQRPGSAAIRLRKDPGLPSTHFQDLAARLAASHQQEESQTERKRQTEDQPEIHAFETQATTFHDKKKVKKEGKRKDQDHSRN